ncbi:MAG TPA: GAF domain-containing protein [Thermoanaerobaculia bacterium]|nr:GAF domain-containing protein [Thermoanaerobaculia bacterium]
MASGFLDQQNAVTRAEQHIRTLVDSGEPLRVVLNELIRSVEQLSPAGMLASILILGKDGRHLHQGGAPSLPAEYNAAIDGVEIGPEVGSCGTAAFHDREVVVWDIANNQLWANFKDVALRNGLRACWSTPIHGSDGRVLGTFANYYPVVRDPSPVDRELTEMITRAAATAIEQHRVSGN